jgi:hypothetical protein
VRRLLAIWSAALAFAALAAAPAGAAFGLQPGDAGFSAQALDADGSVASQAATHPYSLSTEINFNVSGGAPDGDVRDLEIDRPAGLVENPAAVGACTLAQFQAPRNSPFQESRSGESCPLDSQIGLVTVRLGDGGTSRTFGLFNLVAPAGTPSMIGASPFGMPLTFVSTVRSAEGEYRTTLRAREISQQLPLAGLGITLWGSPWYHGHDLERGDCLNEADPENGFGVSASLEKEPQTSPPSPPYYEPGTCSVGNPVAFPVRAYLTLPTSCVEPLRSGVTASSWQQPGTVSRSFTHRDAGGGPLTLEDCGLGELTAQKVIARPNSDRAASPTGFQFELGVNQEMLLKSTTEQGRLIANIRAPAQVRQATVQLPPGMTINPSLAAGLGVCTPAQFAAETVDSAEGAGCPNESKIGQLTVQTPLFERQITGSVYLAQPLHNPYRALIGVYLLARAPERGVIVKLAGKIDADPADGRLLATFDDLPQLPYQSLLVRFRDGQRSPLATPPSCGEYASRVALTPWSSPAARYEKADAFALTAGIGGGPCPLAPAPFAPQAAAGAENRNAGFYSPFFLRFTRTDPEQEITSYSTQLPPGLLGKIAGVPFCPESAIAAARGRDGFAEAERPSCPEAAKIGRTYSGYGMGSVLAYAAGNLYLAGPYHGAPLSILAVNPATVGPFDLGTIIVRSAVRIDPQSARASLDAAGSDPIPHIMRGVPIHLRDVRVYLDRPDFTLNPTSCERFELPSTLSGSGASVAEAGDDRSVSVENPFQVSFCSSLPFAPRIALRLKGGTRRGKFPSLTATVTPRPGDANIGKATVTLPPSEFLAQQNIKTICGRAQYAQRACPKASVYGWARATTPLLEEPLEGPVVLRASDNTLPDLAAQLRGRGIDVDVIGRIDAVKGRLRATYELLPDAPVSQFSLTLYGGKRRGLLVNSDNACKALAASARFVGQNNLGVIRRPRLNNPVCRKQAKKRKAKKNHHHRKGR